MHRLATAAQLNKPPHTYGETKREYHKNLFRWAVFLGWDEWLRTLSCRVLKSNGLSANWSVWPNLYPLGRRAALPMY